MKDTCTCLCLFTLFFFLASMSSHLNNRLLRTVEHCNFTNDGASVGFTRKSRPEQEKMIRRCECDTWNPCRAACDVTNSVVLAVVWWLHKPLNVSVTAEFYNGNAFYLFMRLFHREQFNAKLECMFFSKCKDIEKKQSFFFFNNCLIFHQNLCLIIFEYFVCNKFISFVIFVKIYTTRI